MAGAPRRRQGSRRKPRMRVFMPPRNIAFSVSLKNSGADDHLSGEIFHDDADYMLGAFEPVSRRSPPAITMADDDASTIHPLDQFSTGKPPLNSATPTRPLPSSPPYTPSSAVVYTSMPSLPSTPSSSPVSSPRLEYTPSLPDYYTPSSPDYNCTPSTPDYLPDNHPISPPYSPSSPVQYTPSSQVSSPRPECTLSLPDYYTPSSAVYNYTTPDCLPDYYPISPLLQSVFTPYDILHPHRTIILPVFPRL